MTALAFVLEVCRNFAGGMMAVSVLFAWHERRHHRSWTRYLAQMEEDLGELPEGFEIVTEYSRKRLERLWGVAVLSLGGFLYFAVLVTQIAG